MVIAALFSESEYLSVSVSFSVSFSRAKLQELKDEASLGFWKRLPRSLGAPQLPLSSAKALLVLGDSAHFGEM